MSQIATSTKRAGDGTSQESHMIKVGLQRRGGVEPVNLVILKSNLSH